MSPELKRSTTKRSWMTIIPSSSPTCRRSVVAPASSPSPTNIYDLSSPTLPPKPPATPSRRPKQGSKNALSLTAFFRSLIALIMTRPTVVPSCMRRPGVPSAGPSLAARRVTGTLFGRKNGHATTLAIQRDPLSEPFLLVELAISMSSLIREMASGMARIALECEESAARVQLVREPFWTMYCNGRRCGYAVSRRVEAERRVLRAIERVSVGAGVMPAPEEKGTAGQVVYMRARFERVVGSRDCEAFYMVNLERSGAGPDLSIFLIRL